MKPFNLEAALRGEKVITRDGREVTQLVRFNRVKHPVALWGVVDGEKGPFSWYVDGVQHALSSPSPLDLFMYEEPEEVWTPTNELRFEVRAPAYSYKGATPLRILQQKWITGGGTANEPFKVEWRDVPAVAEEK